MVRLDVCSEREILNEQGWRLADVVGLYEYKFGRYGDHINEGMVSKWARGTVKPSPLHAVRLAELLSTQLHKFYSGSDLFEPHER